MHSEGAGRGEMTISNWIRGMQAPMLMEITLLAAADHVDMDVLQYLLDSCTVLRKLHISFGGVPDHLDTSRPLHCAKPCCLRHFSLTQLAAPELSSAFTPALCGGSEHPMCIASVEDIETMLPSASFMPIVTQPQQQLLSVGIQRPSVLRLFISRMEEVDDPGTLFELKPKPYSFKQLMVSRHYNIWADVRRIGIGRWRKM